MTSRERIKAAINHKEPDLVPIDLGGTICTTLTGTANENLKKYLKIDKGGEIITFPVLDSILPLEEILNLFQSDCRTVRLKGPSQKETKSGEEKIGFSGISLRNMPSGHEFIDEMGTRWRKAGYDYAPVRFPLANFELSDLLKYEWPDPWDPARVRGMRKETKKLSDENKYAVLSDIMCSGPFEGSLWMRGFEQFMVDMSWNKKFAHTLVDRIIEYDMALWEAQLNEIGKYVDVVCQGDDLGMQTGLQISPAMYREFIKPAHKKMFSLVHSKTEAKVWLHSCGSVYEIIPDLIEAGIDILSPVQASAKNMQLDKLKKEFGKNITFWGGSIDIQKLPLLEDLKDVKKMVIDAINIMAPGGGYVFAGTHNILPETPGEKIYTAYMTAVENRDYSKLKK